MSICLSEHVFACRFFVLKKCAPLVFHVQVVLVAIMLLCPLVVFSSTAHVCVCVCMSSLCVNISC